MQTAASAVQHLSLVLLKQFRAPLG